MLSVFPADLAPFPDQPWWAILAVLAAHFFGFFIRGAFGFGSNMPIVLLTTWLLGPHHAILLVALTATAAQLHLFPQGLNTADWPVTRPLLVGMCVGVGLGTWLFTLLASDWLTLIMGVLITWIVAMDRLRLLERLAGAINLRGFTLSSCLAALSGFVGSISGGGAIYFLVVYLKLACSSPLGLRGTNLIISGFFMAVRITLLALAGMFTGPLFVEAALILPVVFLGTWAGTRVFHAASAERFYAGLQILLMGAALALIGKGVVDVL